MNIMADKRDRSSNFTETDKELLMTIIADNFFGIIENKRTDAGSVKEKNDAWENVSELFNAASRNETRTVVQLKNAYNNIKRKLKKENGDKKIEIYKTGGGTYFVPKTSGTKGRLLSLLKTQIEPLQTDYDSSPEYININIKQEPIDLPSLEDMPSTSLEVTAVSEDTPINETLPPSNVSQNSSAEKSEKNTIRKPKRKLVGIYNSVEHFTKTKTIKNNIQRRKTELEIEILLLKKKREEERQEINLLQIQIEKEKLEQEKLKRQQEEVKLLIEKEKYKQLLKDFSEKTN